MSYFICQPSQAPACAKVRTTKWMCSSLGSGMFVLRFVVIHVIHVDRNSNTIPFFGSMFSFWGQIAPGVHWQSFFFIPPTLHILKAFLGMEAKNEVIYIFCLACFIFFQFRRNLEFSSGKQRRPLGGIARFGSRKEVSAISSSWCLSPIPSHPQPWC